MLYLAAQATFTLFFTYFLWRVGYFLITGEQNDPTPAPDPLVDPAVQDLALLTELAVHDEAEETA